VLREDGDNNRREYAESRREREHAGRRKGGKLHAGEHAGGRGATADQHRKLSS
jgi:hypothetical protein